jgi:putative DNA-invertase from lambdoid prophage Rac
MILIYCRVSSQEQVDGTSLADQERKTRAIAQLRGASGYDVSVYSDEGVSGSVPLGERPDGRRLMGDARSGDVIIAAKLDRMFRSAFDALQTVNELQARQIELILIDVAVEPIGTSAVARLFFTLLGAFAEFERARIEERTTDGRKAKRAQNGHLGGQPPFGYRKVGDGKAARLESNPDEQVIIEKVQALRNHAPSVICRELEQLGFRTRAGTTFLIPQVVKMLARGRVQ